MHQDFILSRELIEIMTTNVEQTFASFITQGFSLVAALAWADAIRTLLQIGYFKAHPIVGPIAFACVVTLLAYMLSRILAPLSKGSPGPDKTKKPA